MHKDSSHKFYIIFIITINYIYINVSCSFFVFVSDLLKNEYKKCQLLLYTYCFTWMEYFTTFSTNYTKLLQIT